MCTSGACSASACLVCLPAACQQGKRCAERDGRGARCSWATASSAARRPNAGSSQPAGTSLGQICHGDRRSLLQMRFSSCIDSKIFSGTLKAEAKSLWSVFSRGKHTLEHSNVSQRKALHTKRRRQPNSTLYHTINNSYYYLSSPSYPGWFSENNGTVFALKW